MLDLQRFILSGINDKLQCFICGNYLSYFPIFLCSNNKSVCGRCTLPDDLVHFRDEAFEAMCQFSKFPCCYQPEGCGEELIPQDIPEHEKNCLYKAVPCVIFQPDACTWKGCINTLTHHCQKDHSDAILKNGQFQLDLSVSEETYNLLEYREKMFIFKRKFDSEAKTVECCVYNNEYETNVKPCLVQLSIKDDDKTVLVDFNTTGFDEKTTTKLCLGHVFGDDVVNKSVQGIISVGKIQIPGIEPPENGTNSEMLSILKCCGCGEFAVPPIFRCSRNDNTVCNFCKYRHVPCNQSGIQSDCDCASPRSNILEKLSVLVEYPCVYESNGCTYRACSQDIKKHEEHCDYLGHICPVGTGICRWGGLRKGLEQHLMDVHPDIISNSSEKIFKFDLDSSILSQRIVKFSDHLFSLRYYKDHENYTWTLRKVGSRQNNFTCEIDIIAIENSHRRLFIRQPCLHLRNGINGSKFTFDRSQIFELAPEGILNFKVHIYNY